MEVIKENINTVKEIVVYYKCDECENGNLKVKQYISQSIPNKFQHVCNRCGCERILDKIYPHFSYEEVK